MRKHFIGLIASSMAGAMLASTACMPMSTYHTARTLGDGESSFGMTFSATTYETTQADGEVDRLTIPSIIPELTYHLGLTDDIEVGGRVAPGFVYGELDLKYRFLHNDKLHMAVAPAIGQASLVLTFTSVRLPLLLTYELNPKFAFHMGVTGAAWVVSETNEDVDSPFSSSDEVLETASLSLGFEFTGKTAFIRPMIEYTSALARADNSSERFNMTQVALHFGWVSGRELNKLEQIEHKLDGTHQAPLSWAKRWKPVAASE